MRTSNKIIKIIPVIRVNNRNKNLAFYCQTLGMTNLLEEGATVSLGDKSKQEMLVLEEAPSMRTRKVQGVKKLSKIIIKVEKADEIASLLANGAQYDRLYQGQKGYAFEATSPEGDHFLLHGEDNLADLSKLDSLPKLDEAADFAGLSRFQLEQIEIRLAQKGAADFYKKWLENNQTLVFVEADGQDLAVEHTETWDLGSLKFQVADFKATDLPALFPERESFIPKSGKFFSILDDSKIEVWVE